MTAYTMITGATGGLGKAFAAECASRGMNLYLTDLRPEPLERLASSLRATYAVEVRCHACDLTDERQRSALFSRLADERVTFSRLINVAGRDAEGLFVEQERERIRAILRLNVEAALEMTHALLALRDCGETFRVVNVASLAAFYPMPYKATYAASKRFLLDLSLALREELRRENVTVTALCPAGMPTTPECVAAIEAQGLMGYLTTMNTGTVAAVALDTSDRGRAVVIPGRLNWVLAKAGALIPGALVVRLIDRRWAAAHQRPGLREAYENLTTAGSARSEMSRETRSWFGSTSPIWARRRWRAVLTFSRTGVNPGRKLEANAAGRYNQRTISA